MNPIRILVVDDREENLIAMQAALSDSGYEVVEADSGPSALLRAAESDFAVILLDVQMPGMDGFETARHLRAIPRCKFTPIIFVTAIHRTEAYEELGYVAGAVDFLFKPLNTAILQAKVNVFADLERKTQELHRQAKLLQEAALREQENRFLRETLHRQDEFLSILSHEMKTPITPLNLQVQSFMQMAKEGRLGDVPQERLVRMLQTSQTQIERLSRLVDDLIELSRLKQGRLELRREDLDLSHLIENLLASFALECKRQSCEVKLQCSGPVHGHWDAFRLEQVLTNLLTNALKYGAGKPIEVTLFDAPGKAVVAVRDHGIGIAKEDQKRIFERFERAVSAKNYGGLGLGLYIANHIVDLHGGSLSVNSEPGQGAEFRVELPLRPSALTELSAN